MTKLTTLGDEKPRVRKRDAVVSVDLVKKMKTDSEGGPDICVVAHPRGQLVLVQGDRTLGRDNLTIYKRNRTITLIYTAAEWNAFLQGVRDGEFDDLALGQYTDLIPMRDSKDPDGPALVFSPTHMNRFFMAIRSGKYDLNGPSIKVS